MLPGAWLGCSKWSAGTHALSTHSPSATLALRPSSGVRYVFCSRYVETATPFSGGGQIRPAFAYRWLRAGGVQQIGQEEERAYQIAADGIVEIVRHAHRWEQVADMPNLLDSSRLREMVVKLYVCVLEFLQLSTDWLRRSKLGQCHITAAPPPGMFKNGV